MKTFKNSVSHWELRSLGWMRRRTKPARVKPSPMAMKIPIRLAPIWTFTSFFSERIAYRTVDSPTTTVLTHVLVFVMGESIMGRKSARSMKHHFGHHLLKIIQHSVRKWERRNREKVAVDFQWICHDPREQTVKLFRHFWITSKITIYLPSISVTRHDFTF